MAVLARYDMPAVPNELLRLDNLRDQLRQFEARVNQQLNQHMESNNTTFPDLHARVRDIMNRFNQECEHVRRLQADVSVIAESRNAFRTEQTRALMAQGPNVAGEAFERTINWIGAVVEQLSEQLKEQKEVAEAKRKVAKENLEAELAAVKQQLETINNVNSASITQISTEFRVGAQVIKEEQHLCKAELDTVLRVRKQIFEEWIAADKREAEKEKNRFEHEIQRRKTELAQFVAEKNAEIADRKMALDEREVVLKAELDRLKLDLEKFRIEQDVKVKLAEIARPVAKGGGCVIS